MLRIGLTGGIGSGKSLVANLFSELGVPVIDTDQLAREVVSPNSPGLKKVLAHFGESILLADGSLNRNKLKERIFNNPEERLWLEKTLHPLIRALADKKIQKLNNSYCILVIPLLAENWPHPLVDRVLVIDIPEEMQIKYVTARDNCSPELVKKVMKSQASREDRLAIADDVILNNKDIQHLKDEVTKLHKQYTRLSLQR